MKGVPRTLAALNFTVNHFLVNLYFLGKDVGNKHLVGV